MNNIILLAIDILIKKECMLTPTFGFTKEEELII